MGDVIEFKQSIDPDKHVKQLELLLKEAHDIIDNKNAQMEASDCTLICCGNSGKYDEQGLIHLDTCILVKIRHVIYT